jgi:two-component system, sensor histidine kinase and response regulator
MSLEGFITVMNEPAPDWGSGFPPRILVADDQQYNIQVLGSILGKQGYEIVPASDGPTALKRLALRLPDLILLDVLMPGMDGVEVCRRIRENPEWKDIPIIFLSASDDKEMIVRALEAGGVDYVTKPFNHAEMLSRVRTHITLKRARDRLTQLAEDKDELLGILAHDLKSHLGGIQMSAGLLQGTLAGAEDGKRQQLCENICRSTSQLRVFVQEFLANSATDHGITLKPEPVNLGELVVQAAQNYLEAARRKELTLETAVPREAAIVYADKSALRQVLDNLLSNAVKFSDHGKQIIVSVRSAENSIECRVQDHGPGFNPEDKANMFRRYRRLSARPTGGEPSTGLGLSIVQKLVQALKGELTCESDPGRGATFIVRFPKPATTH